VASDERSCNEIAAILGAAIGKPDLKWSEFSMHAILLSDKDLWRNYKTSENFSKSAIKLDFKRFNTTINFKEYDVVVPITIDDLLICSSNRESIKQDLIPIPSLKAITTCHNKDL